MNDNILLGNKRKHPNQERTIEPRLENLQYTIDSWSSFISNFQPKNILYDINKAGILSKWSVDFKSQKEYILIKLEKTSIIHLVTFGKFKDPTNLKEFKLFVGLDKTDMVEILLSGLSNDDGYEPFPVKTKLYGSYIPCK
jgi:hypothetical protein